MAKSLEERLQLLEDRAEIAELIASYGPIVDSGQGKHLSDMWIADGQYLVGEEYRMHGAEIAALTELQGHQNYLAAGCGHFLSSPTITITGDTAVAINHSTVLMHEGTRWVADRLSANRWDLVRTADGWRVSSRQNFPIDGRKEARDLLDSKYTK